MTQSLRKTTRSLWREIALVALLALALGLAAGCETDAGTDDASGADVSGDGAVSPDACTPSCGVRVCGDDGCGGSCGTCYAPSGAVDDSLCNAGSCCTPTCGDKTCGDNGCGGVCGVCYTPQGAVDEAACVAGYCGGDIAGCTPAGYTSAKHSTKLVEGEPGYPNLIHKSMSSKSFPRDILSITLRTDPAHNGPAMPGTYTLEGENYSDAGIRILLQTGCTSDGCEKTFFATSGDMVIGSTGGTDIPFKATLNVNFEAVTILGGVSAPAEEPELRCMTDYLIDDIIKPDVPEPVCVEEGSGPLVNDNIANFQLQNCLGDWVNLHDQCGQTKVVWFILTAGWCPACHVQLPIDSAYHQSKVADGKKLQLWTIVGEDDYGEAPTLEMCKAYALEHDVDPAWTFVDTFYETTFSNIWGYFGPNGEFGIPFAGFLDGDNMGYAWHSPPTGGTKDTYILNQMLND